MRLPPRVVLRLNRFGEVVARSHHRRIGILGKPWARNARGHRLKTWYTVDGSTVRQHIRFRRTSRFPIKADPWWNPFTWDWNEAFHVSARDVTSCGTNAFKSVAGLAGGTIATNLLLTHVAGRAAIMLPGGEWAYAGIAVYGCIGGFF